jgi:hypothetical protein
MSFTPRPNSDFTSIGFLAVLVSLLILIMVMRPEPTIVRSLVDLTIVYFGWRTAIAKKPSAE